MSTENNALNQRSLAFQVGSSTTTNNLDIQRSASGLFIDMDDQNDNFGLYNNAGTPEGVVAANIGSMCTDTTNGVIYIKQTDTANTGWAAVGGGSGTVINIANTIRTTSLSTTAVIPFDNTIPQITEGASFMTLAFTPTASSNDLLIEVSGYVVMSSGGGASTAIITLFEQPTVNALATGVVSINPNTAATGGMFSLRNIVNASSTSVRTYEVRVGSDLGSTTTWNGFGGGDAFGVSGYTIITITEFIP